MTIKYDYMEDGTPFISGSINNRTTKLAGQLNELTREELNHGALRTEHLPSPIGINGEKAGFPLSGGFGTSNANPLLRQFGGEINPLRVTFSTPIDFNDETQSVDAILVLVNLNISHFLNSDGGLLNRTPYSTSSYLYPLHLAIEDQIMATFTVTYKQDLSSSLNNLLPKSNRTVSPGLTHSELEQIEFGSGPSATRPYLGRWEYICALNGDAMSDKDVAIRTVIRKEDIGNVGPFAGKIASIGLNVQTKFWRYATDGGRVLDETGSIMISKATISAIPMQCRTA